MADKNISEFNEQLTRADEQIIYLGIPAGGGGFTDAFMKMVNVIAGLQQTSEKGQPLGYAELDSDGRVPLSQTSNSILIYRGTWDASTNTPTLSNSDTGVENYWYRCNVAGTVDFGAGPIEFKVGDKAVNNGTIWEKWDTDDSDITADEVIETATRSFLHVVAQTFVGEKTHQDLAIFQAHALGSRPVVSETGSFSVSNTHKNRLLKLDVSAGVVITVDSTTNDDFAVGDVLEGVWLTDTLSNSVVFLADVGITIISDDSKLGLKGVGSGFALVKMAPSIFWLTGQLV